MRQKGLSHYLEEARKVTEIRVYLEQYIKFIVIVKERQGWTAEDREAFFGKLGRVFEDYKLKSEKFKLSSFSSTIDGN